MCLLDIITNVFSDCIFVSIITVLLVIVSWLFRYGRTGKARRFFGFQDQTLVKIYISGFEHSGVATRRVVTALEYETAVEMREVLQKLSGKGVVHRVIEYLAGLVGQTMRYPEPDIEVSPLDEVKEPPYTGSVILIGGPVANQLTKFYLQGSPKFRFNDSTRKYQRRDGGKYRELEPSNDVAVVEKRIIKEQVVILVHGFGEKQTRRAARYLINNWERLYKQHRTQEFGICV